MPARLGAHERADQHEVADDHVGGCGLQGADHVGCLSGCRTAHDVEEGVYGADRRACLPVTQLVGFWSGQSEVGRLLECFVGEAFSGQQALQ